MRYARQYAIMENVMNTVCGNKMKQKLESIIKKGKILALAGIASLAIGCASLKHYVEPRVGAIVPVAEKEQGYKPSFLMGGAYGFNIEKIGLGFEAGLDYFHSSGEYIETNSIWPRLNLNFSPLKQTAKIKPYVMAGVNLLSEFSAIDIPEFYVHDKVKNTTFGIEFGIGATIIDRINGRVTYTMMPASENVRGMISLTAGYRFLFGGKK